MMTYNRLFQLLLTVGLALIAGGPLAAQTFTTLHSFTAKGGNTNGLAFNGEGISPLGGLTLLGNTLYGTAVSGGSSGVGTVFKLNTDGTGFMNLHKFTSVTPPSYTNIDGANPWAGLILTNSTLYGTTVNGGALDRGTVFKLNTDGTGFTNLYSFAGYPNDGANPFGGLILSGNTLYGTTERGGGSDYGSVFAVNTDGTGFTTLYSFIGSDGANPWGGLILSGNTLYGTTGGGGDSDNGTVFKLDTDGTGFTTLYSFTGGSDGSSPRDGLVLSGNILYGTAIEGGTSANNGTVFKVNTNGTGFATLHIFTDGTEGAKSGANLIISGNILYGTAQLGGSSVVGRVFAVNTDGTGFTTLYSFTGGGDGAAPESGLLLSRNTLYGTASQGGNSNNGTVFGLSLGPVNAPQLALIPSGRNLSFVWPTNVVGLTLQSTTNLGSSAVWQAVSTQPVVVNGENTVTNPISSTQQFFRLSQ